MHRPTNPAKFSESAALSQRCSLLFPKGLFGFESSKELTWVCNASEHPFGWLESNGEKGPSFLVVKPQDVGQAYHPQISREDAALLELRGQEAPVILAVVTQHDTGRVTLNLKSPIVLNLDRGKGKQIIPRNVSSFTSQYPLEAAA